MTKDRLLISAEAIQAIRLFEVVPVGLAEQLLSWL